MTRDEFLKRLNRGLAGVSPEAAADIMADYEAHFDAARAEGRSEAEVADALGDPARIAREHKLEAGVRRWETARTPSSAASAIVAVLGLGAIDILVLAPILLPMIGVMVGLYVALIGAFFAGGGVMIAGPFSGFPGGALAAILSGLGLMSAAVAFTALLTIITIWLVNGLIWFGRLHLKLIKPAIEGE